MKSIGLMVAGAAMFLAGAGLTACSFDSTGSTVKGDLSYVQDDLRQKPFKAIDVEAVAMSIIPRMMAMNVTSDWIILPSRMRSSCSN